MKIVIYKDFYGMKATNEANYNKQIANANEIINLNGFTTFEEAKNYLTIYGGANAEYIDKTNA